MQKQFFLILVFIIILLPTTQIKAHDRWLISSKPVVKIGEDVLLEFCVGHGFESEAAPSEWWLTDFYLIDPQSNITNINFIYNKEKQKSAISILKPSKEGIYMVYSSAENIYWVKTKDGRYIQFKDKIDIDKSQIKRTFIGWQYSKTFFRVIDEKKKENYLVNEEVYKKIMGGLIELVPLNDPTNLKVGDYLTLKILSKGKEPKWNIGIVALYKGYPGGLWAYSYFTEYPAELYLKEGILKEPIVKIPITHKGYWFIKAFRMMDREVLCESKYGEHDAYFFEFTMTFFVP